MITRSQVITALSNLSEFSFVKYHSRVGNHLHVVSLRVKLFSLIPVLRSQSVVRFIVDSSREDFSAISTDGSIHITKLS